MIGKFKSLEGKKITIVGLGVRTGVSLARFLVKRGVRVLLYDKKATELLKAEMAKLQDLPQDSLSCHFAAENYQFLKDSDLLITSPGVPLSEPIFAAATDYGIPMVGEMEFAAWYLNRPIVAITGSNGKTTTSWLTAQLMQHWGKRAFLGGNYGVPLIEAVDRDFDFLISETSSFQLETSQSFKPHVAVMLNVTDNHLDRHGTLQNYAAIKGRIFKNQAAGDFAVLNADDPWVMRVGNESKATRLRFSLSDATAEIFYDPDRQAIQTPGTSFSLLGFSLLGTHNIQNLMAVIGIARALGVEAEVVQRTIQQATAPRHRLELAHVHRGVTYINDSKSTTVDSTAKALACFKSPIILILGGKGKGADFRPLNPLLGERMKALVMYGEVAKAIDSQLTFAGLKIVKTRFDEAVAAAVALARPGDSVLLSPAASSLDQFADYEARGDRFITLVKEVV